MAALAWMIVAHGGLAGAIVEGLVVLAFVVLGVAIWFRERHHEDEP